MVNLAELAQPRTGNESPEARAAAIGRVLVCLDRSEASNACLPHARYVAEAFGASVTLLHVLPSTPPPAHESNRSDALEWEIAKREADLYLEQATSTLDVPRDRVQTRLTQGAPAEQIASSARELGADLTVFTSHGDRSGTSDLGSVAQHVLALTSGSVLLIPPTGTQARTPPRRIMVPLDGSQRSECVLPFVAELAHPHSAEVLLVHVVSEPATTALLSDPNDMKLALSLASRLEANAESYLASVRTRVLRQVPVVQTLVVRRNEDRQALLDIAAEQSADMLVLTAHGTKCNADRVFGSVTSYLLSHTRLPTFVVQDMPGALADRASGERRTPSTRPLEAE